MRWLLLVLLVGCMQQGMHDPADNEPGSEEHRAPNGEIGPGGQNPEGTQIVAGYHNATNCQEIAIGRLVPINDAQSIIPDEFQARDALEVLALIYGYPQPVVATDQGIILILATQCESDVMLSAMVAIERHAPDNFSFTAPLHTYLIGGGANAGPRLDALQAAGFEAWNLTGNVGGDVLRSEAQIFTSKRILAASLATPFESELTMQAVGWQEPGRYIYGDRTTTQLLTGRAASCEFGGELLQLVGPCDSATDTFAMMPDFDWTMHIGIASTA